MLELKNVPSVESEDEEIQDDKMNTGDAKKEACEKYDAYQAGEITWDDYQLFMLSLLKNYVKYRIKTHHRTLGAEYEDLMQAGSLAILENLKKFDPHRSSPTSFFTKHIDEKHRKLCAAPEIREHYSATATKLDKVAKNWGYEGLMDPNLTADTLSILAEVSLTTVIETMKLRSITSVSLDSVTENIDTIESHFKNPEQACLDKELAEFVHSQYDKLTDLEKFLIEKTVLSAKPTSYRTILMILKTDEYREMFKDELPKNVDQVFLEQKTNYALRRIRYSSDASRFLGLNNNPIDIVEQATEEDITNAILANIDDF